MEPDLEGFREAQATLIAKLGTDVPFFIPTETTWPAGTPLDPETGEPFDPTVLPLASGFASASARCGVVTSVNKTEEVAEMAIGELEEGQAVLIVREAEYADIADAAECELWGERYTVEQVDRRGIGPDQDDAHRRLIWVRQK